MKTSIELLKLEFNTYLDLAEKITEQVELNQEKLTLVEMQIWTRKAGNFVEVARIVKDTIEKLVTPKDFEIWFCGTVENAWLN